MKRALRILLRVLLALLLLLAVGYVFRVPLFGGVLGRYVAGQLGEGFTIDRIEGSWFFDVAVVGLRGEGVFVERIEVSYRLGGLFGGRPQDAVTSVAVLGADVTVDLTGPSDSESEGEFDLALLPRPLPRTEVKGSIVVSTEQGEVRCRRLEVSGGGAGLDIRLEEVALADHEPVGPARARWTLEGGGWTLEGESRAAGGGVRFALQPGRYTASVQRVDLARLRADLAGLVTGSFEYVDDDLRGEIRVEGLRHQKLRADWLTARGSWDGARGRVEVLEARSGEATVEARDLVVDPEVPYGLASFARVDVAIPDLRAYLPGLELPVRVELRGSGSRVIDLDAKLEAAGSAVTLKGKATLDAEDWRRSVVDFRLSGELGNLSRLHSDLPRTEGALAVAGRLSGTVGNPAASLQLHGREMRVEGRGVSELALAGAYAQERFVIERLRLASEPGSLSLQGTVQLEERLLSDGAFSVDIGDLAGFAAMFAKTPKLRGALKGEGTIRLASREKVLGRCELTGTGLVYDGLEIGTGSLLALDDGAGIVVRELKGAGPWGRLQASGVVRLEKRRARVDALDCEWRGRPGRLRKPLAISWSKERIGASGIDFDAIGGRFAGDLSWTGRVEGRLHGEGVELGRLPGGFGGKATVDVTVSGESFDVEVRAPELTYAGHDGELLARAVRDETGLRVERLSLESGGALTIRGSAYLPARGADGAPALELHAVVTDLSRFADFEAARVTIDLRGDRSGLRGTARVTDLELPGGLSISGESVARIEAGRRGVMVAVETPPGNDGHVSGTIRSKRAVDWTRLDDLLALDEAPLEGDLDMTIPNLGALSRALPVVLHLEGSAAACVQVSGTPRRPSLAGRAEVEDVACTLRGDLPPIRDGGGRLRLRGDVVEIESFTGQLGHAPLTLAGRAHLGRKELDFDLTLGGKNILLARSRYLRLRADVALALRGPLEALHVSGTVRVADALYSEPMDLFARAARAADRALQLFSIREGPLQKMTFDVAITGDESFRIRNDLLRGGFSLDLALLGTGLVPEPRGRVFFRDTLVRLPFSSLKVDRGELRFPPEGPFSPRITVAAHTRMKGYDLEVNATGEVADLAVVVSATPALPQDEALLLLATGATREELERKGVARSALTRVGTFFGKRLVARVSGPSDPDEESFLERFTFEIGRDVTRSGAETVEAEFRVTDRYFLRAERDRFDDYNLGVLWRIRFR